MQPLADALVEELSAQVSNSTVSVKQREHGVVLHNWNLSCSMSVWHWSPDGEPERGSVGDEVCTHFQLCTP